MQATGLLLLLAACGAYAGTNGNKFMSGDGKSMMNGAVAGSRGGTAGFGSFIVEAGTQFSSCQSDPNVPGCKYIAWIFMNLGTFIAIAIIVFLVSFVLCCGRCCCKGKKGTNKQGCTGGNYPTREYNKFEGVACIGLLAVWMLCIFAFTVLGASIWDELKGDSDDFFDGIIGVIETPQRLTADVRDKIDGTKTTIRNALQPLNDVFVGVNATKVKVTNLRTALTNLKNDLESQIALVEGCKPLSPSCTAANRVANWNKCTQASGYTSHEVSGTSRVPATSSANSNNDNPQCFETNGTTAKECPCATQLWPYLIAVQETLTSTPTAAGLGQDLDKPIPVGMLDAQIDEATAGFNQPLEDMEKALLTDKEGVELIKNQLTQEIVSGLSFIFFSPAWYAVIALMCALVLGAPVSMVPKSVNKTGDCCWWTAYTFLAIWIIIASVICAFVGIPGVILYDLCNFLPPPNGTSANVIDAIQGSTDQAAIDLISGLFDDCLLPTNGHIWPIIPDLNITKDYMRAQLSDFDTGNSINTTSITSNLRPDAYTAAFQGVSTNLQAMASTDSVYQLPSGYVKIGSTEETNYLSDVATAITASKTSTTSVSTAIAATKTISSEFEANITKVINQSSSITEEVVELMWSFGSCTILAEAYAGVYDPACNVAYDFAGTFVAAYTAIMFGIVLLPFICCSSKRYYQYREDGAWGKQEELLQAKASGQNVVVPLAAVSGAPGAPAAVAVATAVPVASAVAVPAASAVAAPAAGGGIYPDVSK